MMCNYLQKGYGSSVVSRVKKVFKFWHQFLLSLFLCWSTLASRPSSRFSSGQNLKNIILSNRIHNLQSCGKHYQLLCIVCCLYLFCKEVDHTSNQHYVLFGLNTQLDELEYKADSRGWNWWKLPSKMVLGFFSSLNSCRLLPIAHHYGD